MAFATTWALGQLAKQYYGGGRTLDAGKLKSAFAPLLEQGQGLIGRYGAEKWHGGSCVIQPNNGLDHPPWQINAVYFPVSFSLVPRPKHQAVPRARHLSTTPETSP